MSLQFRHKIILLSAGILLLSIGAFAINNYFFLKGNLQAQIKDNIGEIGQSVANNMSTWLNDKLATVKSVATAAAQTGNDAELLNIVRQGAAFQAMPDVYVGMDDGRFIISTPNYTPTPGYDPRVRPWYQLAQQQGRAVFTEPYVDSNTKDLVITAAAPFSGASRGVAGGDLFLTVLTDMVNAIDFLGLGYGFMVNDKNEVLTHSDEALVGKPVQELFIGKAPSVNPELTEAEMAEGPVLVSFIPVSNVESIKWKIAVILDRNKAYAPLASFRNSAFIYALIGVIVVTGLMTMLLSQLMKPVTELGQTMQDIAQGEGDLTQRLKVDGDDEFAQLAKGFNGFASKVQDLVKGIIQSIQTMAKVVEEMKHSASRTSSAVAAQRQETEMVATAVNETSAAAREIAQNASLAADAAKDADIESDKVHTVVADAVRSIAGLSDQIGEASEVINALEGDVGNIVSVLSVIRGIAEQTNLLALNAAIEAARAGEAGRGFAVVADEVRALASKTQESTEEIQSMITRLQEGSNKAVNSMEQSRTDGSAAADKAQSAGESLNVIIKSIGTISEMNTQIATASEEQTSVTEDISKSITSIADAAEQTDQGTKETAATSHQLHELAEELRHQIERFKV